MICFVIAVIWIAAGIISIFWFLAGLIEMMWLGATAKRGDNWNGRQLSTHCE